MTSRHTRGVIGSAVFAVVLVLTSAAAPSAGASVAEPVAQWNIYGGCSGAGSCGGTAATALYKFFVGAANPKPFSITVNEICAGPQFSDLYNYFTSLGYQARFVQTNIGVNCGTQNGTGIHGNAVFALGAYVAEAPSTSPAAQTGHIYWDQYSSGDVRSLKCLTANLFGYVRNSCVTHLHPPPPGTITTNQNSEALSIMALGSGSTPSSLGGDFNTTTPSGWGAWWEVDASRHWTYSTPNSSTRRKIDWIFGNKSAHVSFGGAGTYCSSAAGVSDHCLLTGTFFVP